MTWIQSSWRKLTTAIGATALDTLTHCLRLLTPCVPDNLGDRQHERRAGIALKVRLKWAASLKPASMAAVVRSLPRCAAEAARLIRVQSTKPRKGMHRRLGFLVQAVEVIPGPFPVGFIQATQHMP